MIYSMTGQGRASVLIKPEGLRLSVEAQSVNHRYLDINVKLPDQMAGFEDNIRQLVKRNVSRGSVSIIVHLEQSNGKILVHNPQVLENFLDLLSQLEKKAPVSRELTPESLLRIPGLIKEETRDIDAKKLWNHTGKVVETAIKDMVKMRKAEGKNLELDLKERLSVIGKNLNMVKKRIPQRTKQKKLKLIELLEAMEIDHDRNRLLQEVLYFSERFDIHEECVRLENHLKLFKETLRSSISNGRRLNFTTQEMMKETNTIGSKANDTEITHYVISIKEEVEKIREQVQNVE